jgi:translation initiation factor 2 subunit 3
MRKRRLPTAGELPFLSLRQGGKPPCERPGCGHHMKLIRHFQFIDLPGHDILMVTILNGAVVMNTALLIPANETCPQRQTSEYLVVVE